MIFVFDGGLGWGLVFRGTWYVRRTVQYLNIKGARKVIYINKKRTYENITDVIESPYTFVIWDDLTANWFRQWIFSNAYLF